MKTSPIQKIKTSEKNSNFKDSKIQTSSANNPKNSYNSEILTIQKFFFSLNLPERILSLKIFLQKDFSDNFSRIL